MVIRRYWMWGVVVLLTATVGIVALDLRDAAQRQAAPHFPLRAGAAHLEPIRSGGAGFAEEDFSLYGEDFAFLEESRHDGSPIGLLNEAVTTNSPDSTLQPVPSERSRPTELPDLESVPAVPLMSPGQRESNTEAIRKVYPDATDEQIEFWLEETRGLPPEMIREMLRLRKQIGPLTDTFDPRIPEILPEPKLDEDSGVRAMRQARAIVLQNLANAETIGYLRTEVHFVDDLDETGRRTLKIAERTLATDPGKVIGTGESLEIALETSVFLEVVSGGREYVTRYGRLRIGADRGLELAIDGGEIVVSPGLAVASDGGEIRITVQGEIQTRDDEIPDWISVGDLPLVTIPRPKYLKPCGNSLYAPTELSGRPVRLAADHRIECVRPESVESSNVNWDREQELLKRLDWLIEHQTR